MASVNQLHPRMRSAIVITESGCWLWTRSTNQDGYAQILLDGKHQYVHRVAYQSLIGPIPEGLQLDHLCRVKTCCNPEHLEPVTLGTNIHRSFLFRQRKTHCFHGHEYTTENIYVDPRGLRHCRACATMHRATYKANREARIG